ncbi:uncharacterized protein N7484_000278 [Penicillium longicatenatum]|uniref:uncharacterized protein n=1 Tax=Penicillium longicatenatum TaxID=1561947 RepID=UPI0025477DDF|nr:uncharacterized protein N7484_000278 [Penicillium longicatenatum]KAJ5660906.1 hypothetical protein N7484_000278 [Penicillium longicatenatum]
MAGKPLSNERRTTHASVADKENTHDRTSIAQSEYNHSNPAEWGPVPPIEILRDLSGIQNGRDTYVQLEGTFYGPQLDSIAEQTDQERTRFNPLTSNALFNPFLDSQLNNIQLDQLNNSQLDNIARETDQERTRFNPLASNALFNPFPDSQLDNIQLDNIQLNNLQLDSLQLDNIQLDNIQLDNIQLDNIQLDNIARETDQERTRFNPLASNALFNPFSDSQLDNIQLDNIQLDNSQLDNIQLYNSQLDNIQLYNSQLDNSQLDNIARETDQERTRFNPLASNAVFSPFSSSPLANTSSSLGPTGTDFAIGEIH